MKTRAELIDEVLDILGLTTFGASAAEDVNKVDSCVDGVVDDLAARDIYFVQDAGIIGPSGGAIEGFAFQDVALSVAVPASRKFNMDSKQYEAQAERAEARLITKTAPSRSRRLLRTEPGLNVVRRGTYRF